MTGTYVQRGDIFYVDLGKERKGNIQNGIRPCVICGNNLQNKHSGVVLISPITSSKSKKDIPTHLKISASESHLKSDSIVLFEQIQTVQKSQLKSKICSLNDDIMQKVNDKLMISLGIAPAFA